MINFMFIVRDYALSTGRDVIEIMILFIRAHPIYFFYVLFPLLFKNLGCWHPNQRPLDPRREEPTYDLRRYFRN